jgi:hypothetical protein
MSLQEEIIYMINRKEEQLKEVKESLDLINKGSMSYTQNGLKELETTKIRLDAQLLTLNYLRNL